jgi:hypothetical protein
VFCNRELLVDLKYQDPPVSIRTQAGSRTVSVRGHSARVWGGVAGRRRSGEYPVV